MIEVFVNIINNKAESQTKKDERNAFDQRHEKLSSCICSALLPPCGRGRDVKKKKEISLNEYHTDEYNMYIPVSRGVGKQKYF